VLVVIGHMNVLDAYAEGEFFYGDVGLLRQGFG